MPVRTCKLGETIDLGGGAVLAVTGVGRKEVRFRATLPAGVSVRRASRTSAPSSSAGLLLKAKSKPWAIGFAVHAGGTAVIGGAIRLTLKRIDDPRKFGLPRVAHIAVEGRWPPTTPEPAPRPMSPVRPIDELTPEELARAIGWGAPRPKRTN